MTVKIKQYPTKEKDAKDIVWSSKRPLLNILRKILSIVQQKFKVDRKKVCEWIQKEEKATFMKEKRFRLDGGGWKLTDVELE